MAQRRVDRRKYTQGMTLIEIMVVIAIIGILAALIVPNVMRQLERSRVVKTKQDINALEQALSLYQLDSGSYPTNEQGLPALVTKPTIPPVPELWGGPYVKSLPKDPWGNPYQYRNPGQHSDVDVFSYGMKGPQAGESSTTVIGNWESS